MASPQHYQINQWVLGVEGDFAGTTIKNSVNATVVGPGAVLTGNAEASLDWVSTLAPRVGYAFNNWFHCYYTTREQCEEAVNHHGICIANSSAPTSNNEAPQRRVLRRR